MSDEALFETQCRRLKINADDDPDETPSAFRRPSAQSELFPA
jgi:hypothetical protein